MRAALSLLVVLLAMAPAAASSSSARPPSFKLDLALHMYCTLHVGSPPAMYRFRVDDAYSQLYLRKNIQQTSASAVISAVLANGTEVTDTYGSEVFRFHGASLRMPVVWLSDMPSPPDGLPSLSYYGILGIAARSPLWKYWRGYAMDAWTLRLNAFSAAPAPVWSVPLWEPMPATCYAGGASRRCAVTADMDGEHSWLPPAARHHPDFFFSLCDAHVRQSVEMNKRRNTNGGYALALKYSRENDSAVQLGFWALRFFSRSADMYALTWSLCPARFYNVTAENDHWFSVAVPLLLLVLAGMWLLGVASMGFTATTRAAYLLYAIKTYALLWMVAFVALGPRCYEGAAMWRKVFHSPHAGGYYALTALSLAASVADLVVVSLSMTALLRAWSVSRGARRVVIMANKLLFEPNVLLVVWLSLVVDCEGWSSMAQALGVAFLLLVIALVNLYLCVIYRMRVAWVAALVAAAAIAFAVIANLSVFLRDYGMPYMSSGANQYLVFGVAVVYVAGYVALSYDDSHIKSVLSELAEELDKKNA